MCRFENNTLTTSQGKYQTSEGKLKTLNTQHVIELLKEGYILSFNKFYSAPYILDHRLNKVGRVRLDTYIKLKDLGIIKIVHTNSYQSTDYVIKEELK